MASLQHKMVYIIRLVNIFEEKSQNEGNSDIIVKNNITKTLFKSQ